MRYITVYLLYAAVLIRGLAWYGQTPLKSVAIALIVPYGVLLVVDQLVFERRVRLDARTTRIYPYAYLAVQACLVVALLLLPPRPDFSAILFIPLSMQAALWFDRRAGFLSVAILVALMTGPLLVGWETGMSALALVLLYGAACFMIGSYASLVKRAETARMENLRLYDELKQANRQLQDYSAQVEELATAKERNHLARELHDSVTQTVFSMTLAVQAARMLWDKDQGRVTDQLGRLQELARSAVGEIQVLVAQLRPTSLAEEGLATALKRHCDERKSRDGLQVCLDVISNKALPELLTVGLYRIVQEALNNVAKHANTQQATVRLDLASAHPFVEVSDEGVGFAVDVTTRQTGHMGLIGMAERARELGWVMHVNSRPGRGTRIRVEEQTETYTDGNTAMTQTHSAEHLARNSDWVAQTYQPPAYIRNQWLRILVGYAFIAVVAVRTLINISRVGTYSAVPAVVLLSLILLLYATEPFLSRRVTWYPYLYTLLYSGLALALGLQQPYFDMWGTLFLPLSVQVSRFFPSRIAVVWLTAHMMIVTLGLTLTLGMVGFTTSLTMIAGGAALVSFELLYTQAEMARRNSQKLLADLREAHRKLMVYAEQAEELAATQERNRLARDLHDTVNQEIFSITLNAQAVRLLLDRDPARVPAQLDQLQEMTGNILAELRSLITQLRPPQGD